MLLRDGMGGAVGRRAELCELSTVVTKLQRMLAAERAKVLD
jgi:hypothetical protein